MTHSTGNPTAEAELQNVQITFRNDITQSETRALVERSVRELVARSAEQFAQAHAADTTREKLLAAVNAPLDKLIQEDPTAAKALEELRNYDREANRKGLELEASSTRRDDPRRPDIDDLGRLIQLSALEAGETRALAVVPPYHFAWSWFDEQWSPPFAQIVNNEIGRVTLDSRSGSGIPGGAPRKSIAAAGFGLYLTTDREVQATGYSSCRLRWEWSAAPDLWDEVKGYMEFRALEDGFLLASSPHQPFLFYQLVRRNERGHERGGPLNVSYPRELVFTMRPNREYIFTVGLVVATQSSHLFPDRPAHGAARAFLDGDVNYIAIVRR